MKLRTNDQNRKLHVLLTQAGLLEEKKSLVSLYTNGRTESSRELYIDEARRLIEDLERQSGKPAPAPEARQALQRSETANRMRRKIIAICYEIEWIESTDDPEERKVNMARIDLFLKERGYLKKPLNAYTPKELPKLVSQFEQIRTNLEQSRGSKAVKELLSELEIPVMSTPKKKRKP